MTSALFFLPFSELLSFPNFISGHKHYTFSLFREHTSTLYLLTPVQIWLSSKRSLLAALSLTPQYHERSPSPYSSTPLLLLTLLSKKVQFSPRRPFRLILWPPKNKSSYTKDQFTCSQKTYPPCTCHLLASRLQHHYSLLSHYSTLNSPNSPRLSPGSQLLSA